MATPRTGRTSGGTGTTVTFPAPRPTPNGSKCRTRERPPSGNRTDSPATSGIAQAQASRRGEMISNTTDLPAPEVGQSRQCPKPGVDFLLSLAAAPVFELRPLLHGVLDGA